MRILERNKKEAQKRAEAARQASMASSKGLKTGGPFVQNQFRVESLKNFGMTKE